MRFEGKTVLVTGAAGGIGQTLTTTFVTEGARVAVTDLDTAMLTTTADARFDGDLTDRAFCDALPRQVHDRFGRLDILVNNAGWTTRVDHADHAALTNEILFKTIEVNVYGTWWMCKAAMPHLKSTEGCIVNVTSIAGLRPMGSSLAYGMAKAALNALTEDLAKFHGPVRCNAVAPGLVATPWTSEWGDLHTSIAAISPAGRSATPEDCAMAVMACVTNTYMSGTILKVDGGTTLAL